MHLTVRGAESKLQKCQSSYYKARVYTSPKNKNPFWKINCENLNKAIKSYLTITYSVQIHKYNQKKIKRERRLNRERLEGVDPFLRKN